MQHAIDTIRTLVRVFKKDANKTPCMLLDLVDSTLQDLSDARHPDPKDGKTWARPHTSQGTYPEDHIIIRSGPALDAIDHMVNSKHDNQQTKLDKIDEYVKLVSQVLC
ncbi:hypothetical protein [Thiolapillus sp.]|uniref:hypothetical protein n=1 Tax=Thiolapillus sp. TaxID=2017437 RepID=UPI003AF44EBA